MAMEYEIDTELLLEPSPSRNLQRVDADDAVSTEHAQRRPRERRYEQKALDIPEEDFG